jgi:hypothetical protein
LPKIALSAPARVKHHPGLNPSAKTPSQQSSTSDVTYLGRWNTNPASTLSQAVAKKARREGAQREDPPPLIPWRRGDINQDKLEPSPSSRPRIDATARDCHDSDGRRPQTRPQATPSQAHSQSTPHAALPTCGRIVRRRRRGTK